MNMADKEKKRTGSGVSDPQGPAGAGSTVPAPPPSSSSVGLPSGSRESPGGELAISLMAKGLSKALSADKRKAEVDPARKRSGSDSGAQDRPAPATPGPSTSGAEAEEAVFKRPGPLSSKMKKKEVRPVEKMDLTREEDSSDDVSDGEGALTPFSDMSSDTNRALGFVKKRGRGRPSTTGEWVGVEAVRHELALLKKEHERVVAERDVLAARFRVDFERTAGKTPSAYEIMEGFTNETVGSLLDIVMEEMAAVERVAERSGSLQGTFKGKLRAASRRTVAASRLLFTRANASGRGEMEEYASERARCELQAAKNMLGEAEEKVRRLEEEVKVLKAKEILRASAARGASPPPRRTPHYGVEVDEVPMEVEDSPVRVDPPEGRASAPVVEDLQTDTGPSLDLVERIVSRILERLSPRGEIPDRPPTPSRPPPDKGEERWNKVVGRRARKEREAKASEKEIPPPTAPGKGGKKRRRKKKRKGPKQWGAREKPAEASSQKKKAKAPAGVVREPRTGAVLVTADPSKGASMAKALLALRPVAVELIGSKGEMRCTSLKRAQAGGTLIRISGEDGHRLADELAAKLREAASKMPGVGVRRPLKRAELRLQGLDDSITREEVIGAITGLMDCRAEDLTVGEIRFLPYRLGSVWLRCPVAVSNKLVEAGDFRIGWTRVVVKPLKARRMRCFRCLEVGHGMMGCKGPDRSGRCHRCGDCSHRSRQCTAGVPKCPLCAEFGVPAGHSLGADACCPSGRVAQRRQKMAAAKAAKEKEGGKGGTRSRGEDATPTASGKGSKRGPCRAEPSETLAPAGSAEGERGVSPVEDEGPSSRAPEKGSTGDGGDRQAKSSLKRTASDRSPAIQRRTEVEREQEGEEKEKEGSPPPPPPALKKRRDRRGRFKTR
ncbi:CCHC-type domain-containing protein [Camponotus japonicus]